MIGCASCALALIQTFSTCIVILLARTELSTNKKKRDKKHWSQDTSLSCHCPIFTLPYCLLVIYVWIIWTTLILARFYYFHYICQWYDCNKQNTFLIFYYEYIIHCYRFQIIFDEFGIKHRPCLCVDQNRFPVCLSTFRFWLSTCLFVFR